MKPGPMPHSPIQSIKKYISLFFALILPILVLAGCGGKTETASITRLEQLSEPGRKIGVGIGTGDDIAVRSAFPDAEVELFNDGLMGYSAVADGSIDAFCYSKRNMELAIRNGREGVRLLDEIVGEGDRVAVGLSPKSKIPDLKGKINSFIAEKQADGTLDDMYERWAVKYDETMPEIDVPEKADIHLRVGTVGLVPPFSYYAGTELKGYDIELARRFAAWLGAELEFKIYDYTGLIAAAQSGDVDCIMSELYVTPEREETIPFSDPLFIVELGVMVRDTGAAANQTSGAESGALISLDDLAHAKIGVETGTNFPDILAEYLPEAEILYFNSTADQINALKSGKIAAFMQDSPVALNMLMEDDALAILPEELGHFDFAFAFTKSESGKALCDALSDFIRDLKADGTLERLQNKWFDSADLDAVEMTDYRDLPAVNGTLKLATTEYPPFDMQREEMFAGYEIELLTLFCRVRGYALEITEVNFEALLPALQAGKCDVGCSSISVTEERKENVLFSEPDYSGGAALVVMKEAGAAEAGGFLSGVKESFEKTFIRENRWKLFVQGIGTTLLITVLSIILGTALGFGVYLLCRNGNPVANGVTRFFVWLIHGMPMVVLLMILYYVIFGKVAISGTIVAIIGFTLVFGASVFGMLKSGVGAVEKGQMEAAYALGYTDNRAFFRVILPQALPHFFPAYKGEITATIKATAIVGYVAVQDLTKMGDIVRSRTYEAFFPLIAVAIIYFILAGILTAIVNRLGVFIDPRRRKKEDVLKGVTVE